MMTSILEQETINVIKEEILMSIRKENMLNLETKWHKRIIVSSKDINKLKPQKCLAALPRFKSQESLKCSSTRSTLSIRSALGSLSIPCVLMLSMMCCIETPSCSLPERYEESE
ncbi:uncharacterized protein LOC120348732 isoform X6 [Nilaparvata lugens]|uniref:uncharacterized protein LOC120348732 isoform X6 n=1 Tax=Nilaparvata lugens TaxID=108931 RepID=UPI00193EA013|nr:uncharacterized protein LOC120348732 isoform X6 [Nilaparvata lugens]XP_039282590.1 uncharacterized protein LOC120348732 isoform X6 [Nilaparvata lugens]XP_039282598.1 uncharacterized protein LOC120348732 isoform X6 [Nilaparvata lugens]